MAPVEGPLAQYQMSLRYFVLDERGLGEDDLPEDNLVASLVESEASRSPEDLARAASRLPGWFRDGDEPELRRSFLRWASEVAAPPGSVSEEVLGQMEEEPAMLAEWAKEWYEEARLKGIEQGIERGMEQGRAEERARLCRWAERKFGPGTSARLSGLLDRLTAPGQLDEIRDWLIDCDTGADLSRVRSGWSSPRPDLSAGRSAERSLARICRSGIVGWVSSSNLHKAVRRTAGIW